MNSISPILNIMIKACEKASKVIIRDFGEIENLQVAKKGPRDFVTKTDKKVEEILIEEDEVEGLWYPNQFVMMVSNANDKKTALARFKSHHIPLKNIIHDRLPDWNISSRNKEQAFAMDLLMNPDIKITIYKGVNHNSWDMTYNNKKIYDWILKYKN